MMFPIFKHFEIIELRNVKQFDFLCVKINLITRIFVCQILIVTPFIAATDRVSTKPSAHLIALNSVLWTIARKWKKNSTFELD